MLILSAINSSSRDIGAPGISKLREGTGATSDTESKAAGGLSSLRTSLFQGSEASGSSKWREWAMNMSDTKSEVAVGPRPALLDPRETDVALGGSRGMVAFSSATSPSRGNGASDKSREKATPDALAAGGLRAIPPVPG